MQIVKTSEKRQKIYKECSVCGTLFYCRPSLLDKRFTCSSKCMGITRLGGKMSAESRAKLSKSCMGKKGTNNGKKFSKEHCNRISKALKNVSPEVAEKRRELCRGIQRVSYGEDNPAWKGGVSRIGQKLRNTKDYADWRDSVFLRDNYTCYDCGARNGDIEAHHIIGFAEDETKRLDVDNGRTLCTPCHKMTHSRLR